MIHISSNWRAIHREIDRIEKMPNRKAKSLLGTVLEIGFKQSQEATHVITGSLKGSGKKTVHTAGSIWTGNISYGGLSIGINNPVDYAIYEKARRGSHDNMGNIHLLHSMYIEAILKGLSK